MKVYYELDLENFEAWSGAEDTLDRIRNEGKTEVLESILEELYPEGIDKTQLNDLLRFEDEQVFEWLGIRSESVIEQELKDAKEELSDLKEEVSDLVAEYNDECIGIADWERKELWDNDYKDNYDDLQEQIKETQEKIEELEEELESI